MIVQKWFLYVRNETRLKMTLHIITCLITVETQLTIIELYFAIQPFAKFFVPCYNWIIFFVKMWYMFYLNRERQFIIIYG